MSAIATVTDMPSVPSKSKNDFISLYLHAAGVSEVPREYHRWCAMSLIAALVSDRVHFQKFAYKRLLPNLYVLLLGPSGIAKGTAMDFAMSLLDGIPHHVNLYNGRITAPKLIDRLGKPDKKRQIQDASIYLMTPELASSIRTGSMSDDFVKLMTDLYGGHTTWSDGTRTHGDVTIKNCCINWLGASIRQWFVESIPASSLDGGAMARCILVPAEYNYDVRVPRPQPPDDFDAVVRVLKKKCLMLSAISGEFEVTERATVVHDQWYMHRPPESESALEAAWHRDDDLCYKLAMILSLSEDINLVIDSRHVVEAQKLVSKAHQGLPQLLAQASQTVESKVLEHTRGLIKRNKRITHRALLTRLSKSDKADDIKRATRTLYEIGEVAYEDGPKGGRIYVWKGGK